MFGVVMQGHIRRNVSPSVCTIAWTLVCFHKGRQLCCSWRMWCYGNTITYVLFRLLLCRLWLLHYWVNNFLTVSLSVEMSRKRKKNTCRFIFNSHLKFHPNYLFHNFLFNNAFDNSLSTYKYVIHWLKLKFHVSS